MVLHIWLATPFGAPRLPEKYHNPEVPQVPDVPTNVPDVPEVPKDVPDVPDVPVVPGMENNLWQIAYYLPEKI